MIPSLQEVRAAADAIRSMWSTCPRVGIILGTGLGDFISQLDVQAHLSYESIPGFASATALGHRGAWVCGTLCGAGVVAMDGRLHGYEGYSAAQVTFPVRVMHSLGVELLIISNACGGMNPKFRSGDVMMIEDHVNLTWDNPLVGPHDVNPGLGYPDMSHPYNPALIERACRIARQNGIVAHRGTYVGVLGPNYETRAEYRFLRRIGGDAVGMSTVWEVIVAAQCGLRVLGLSVVTNLCSPDHLQPTSAQQVAAIAASAEPKVRAIVLGIVEHEAGQPTAK